MAVPKRRPRSPGSGCAAAITRRRAWRTQACPRCGSPKLSAPRLRVLRLLPRQEAGRGRGRLSVIRVALDAMGGDQRPAGRDRRGARGPRRRCPATFLVQLVGRTDAIEAELARHPDVDRSRLEVHEAPDVIGMDEKPLAAVRKKPNSSIVVGLGLQKAGAVRRVRLRRQHRGDAGRVDRAARAPRRRRARHGRHAVSHRRRARPGPRRRRQRRLLRPGAGRLRLPRHRLHARRPGRPRPGRRAAQHRRGGGEGERGGQGGPPAAQAGRRACNYVGNIEGRDILAGPASRGHVDVVVCDGFVGNIVLKFYESAARLIVRPACSERAPDVFERPDAARDVPHAGLLRVRRRAAARGARASPSSATAPPAPNAIKNAIRVALQAVRAGLNAAHRRRVRAARAARHAHDRPVPSRRSPSLGVAVPPRVVTNADFEQTLDTSDQWIVERTGIRERRYRRARRRPSPMLSAGGRLHGAGRAGVGRDRSRRHRAAPRPRPDRLLPSTACDLQALLGAEQRRGLRHRRRLPGFIYALTVAEGLIASGQSEHGAGRRRREALHHHRLRRTAPPRSCSATAPAPRSCGASTVARPRDSLDLHQVRRPPGAAAATGRAAGRPTRSARRWSASARTT